MFRWQQSRDITVKVGPKQTTFVMRETFLRKRSPFFKQQLAGDTDLGETKCIRLLDVSEETFQRFMLWSYEKEPMCSTRLDLHGLLNLAIMAIKYDTPALQHQVSDRLRQNLGGAGWKIGPGEADKILLSTKEGSWLQRLLHAKLCTILPSTMHNKDEQISDWEKILIKHPKLAIEWKKSDLREVRAKDANSGGPCRFHDHNFEHFSREKESSNCCPYISQELYPTDQRKDERKTFVFSETQAAKASASSTLADGNWEKVPVE